MKQNVARWIAGYLPQVKIWKDPQYSDAQLYACDQICASEIAQVPNNGKEISFFIHPTNPATPIVYIATQKEQLLTLRLVLVLGYPIIILFLFFHPMLYIDSEFSIYFGATSKN